MFVFAHAHAHAFAMLPFVLGGAIALTILGDCVVALIRIFREN